MNARRRPTLTRDRLRTSDYSPKDREQPPIEWLLEVVTDPARRRLLETLRSGTDWQGIDSLLEADAGDECTRATQRASLYHNHLPRLEDVGLVEIDWDRRLIYYRPDARLEALLDTVSTLSEWETVERPRAAGPADRLAAGVRRLRRSLERRRRGW